MSDEAPYDNEINYKKANLIINLFFIVIDILILFVLLLCFKTTITVIKLLRFILFRIILIDILICALYLIKYNILDIFKEVDITIAKTRQFFLIISFFEEVYSITIKTEKNKQNLKKFQMSLFFFIITLSYHKLFLIQNTKLFIIYLDKIIIIIQSICAMLCLYKIYLILKKKNNEILNIIKYNSNQLKAIHHIFLTFPLPSFMLFIIYYLLKIIVLFFHGYYYFFGKLIIDIVKYAVKYYILIINFLLINEIKKIKLEEERRKMAINFTDVKVVVK